MSRRAVLLAGLVTVLVAAAVLAALLGRGARSPHAAGPAGPASPPAPATTLGPVGVTAAWVIEENRRPGSPEWRIGGTPGGIEGFADQVYASRGQTVTLYVSGDAPRFHVEAYRVGYYQGAGARLVWRSDEAPAARQPPCPVTPGTNMVACDNWAPSLRMALTPAFVPGDYLLKLVGSGGAQSYVPLTVWDPASHATYLVKNDVFTWQAWNPYGGFDFYAGHGTCRGGYPLCSRARVVSDDRPYGDGQGTGDFLDLEAPLVWWAEENGLDVSYATDLTLVQHPEVALAHRALLSLGHDECWSLAERRAAVAAHDHGVNLVFFGASPILRHVRLQDSPLGQGREVVDYRDAAEDPLNGRGDPLEVTGNTWAAPPANWPESDFVGAAYNGFLRPNAPPGGFTVVDAGAWIFAGTGLRDGAVVPGVIRSDVDRFDAGGGHPPDVQIFGHSPLPVAQAEANTRNGPVFYSDMTYYTDPRGHAGVFDSGTNNWIPALAPCPRGVPCPAEVVRRITGNLLRVFGQGPAGDVQPSQPNWQRIYPPAAR
ncbi:N,N-dimethylformamidase beta subunit family domain-containing protein [Gandjariella thermophila]|uniref:N,N-dimethylformamidase beta subunit-like C-terminal domain-containing protein n=1 Tax=Gandjariella thermophila TaxID=1931992 RepID=A0A4D4J9H2_9PSEU|nr:N,N-dimethylformamidase beta subunit family domain-containing protein [Gandjariella thermophila]GDY31650.1 hypothetical protein GTS_32830 [Gandjariella thermophila]